jgi:glycosyltransferase involved in cell wall biosynthesis
MQTSNEIHILLPYKEGFSPISFGAISLYVKDLSQLSKHAQSITVFSGNDTKPYFADINFTALSIKRHFFKTTSSTYIDNYLKSIVNTPKIIEIHNRPIYAHHLIKKKLKTKLWLFFHNNPLDTKGSKTKREREWLLMNCDKIIFVSDYVKNNFFKDIEVNNSKCEVIYNCAPDLTPQVNLRENIVVFVGRIIPEKGVYPLAEAMSIFLKENKDWKLAIAGSSTLNGGKNKLTKYEKEVMQKLELVENQVIYLGFTSYKEVLKLFAKAKIAIIPSIWEEPFGRVALEAITCGCFPISSTNGGLKEIVNGIGINLAPGFTYKNIYDALKQYLNDDNLVTEFKEQSKKVIRKFSKKRMISKLDKFRTQAGI